MVYTQVLENEMYKTLLDFEKQTGHLISARQPDLVIVNKEKRICRIMDLAVLADHMIKLKESKKRYKYLDLARELKKLCNMKVMMICNWYAQYSHQRIGKGAERLGNKRTSGHHPNYSIKIG